MLWSRLAANHFSSKLLISPFQPGRARTTASVGMSSLM